jgi:hypothetical protein
MVAARARDVPHVSTRERAEQALYITPSDGAFGGD